MTIVVLVRRGAEGEKRSGGAVAELMQELGAVSRLQAGVHAVELGLLTPETSAA